MNNLSWKAPPKQLSVYMHVQLNFATNICKTFLSEQIQYVKWQVALILRGKMNSIILNILYCINTDFVVIIPWESLLQIFVWID